MEELEQEIINEEINNQEEFKENIFDDSDIWYNNILSQKLNGCSISKSEEIKNNLAKPSKIFLQKPDSLINFTGYKGDFKILFKELSNFYLLTKNWRYISPLIFFDYVRKEENLTELLVSMSFLQHSSFKSNLIEILATLVKNQTISRNFIIDLESEFQNFKRIYLETVQLFIIPFLFYIFSLDKRLTPILKEIWDILLQKGKFSECSFILNEIQRSNIRMKKSKELLQQENFDIRQKCEINLDLLIILTDKNSIYYPVFEIVKEYTQNPELDLKELVFSKFNIESKKPIKPFAQQLIVFSSSNNGKFIKNELLNYPGFNLDKSFKDFLFNTLSQVLPEIEVNYIDFNEKIRDLIFSSLEIVKRRSWDISQFISDFFISFLENVRVNSKNDFFITIYYLTSEFIAGVNKVKYKIEEALHGIARSYVTIPSYFSNVEIIVNNIDSIFEYIYFALYDTVLELYVTFIASEKIFNSFDEILIKEMDKFKKDKFKKELEFFKSNTSTAVS